MHSLIIGMGALGQQLAVQLLAQGHQVTGLRRSAVSVSGVQMLVQSAQQADLSSIAPLQQAYVIVTPDQYDEVSYRQTFIESIQPLRQALSAHPLQRLYFISSTSVYGQDQGEWVNEASPTQPHRYNGQVLLEAEKLWQQVYPEQLVVIRPSGIYDEHRLRLVKWLQSGCPVTTQAWTNRIHSEDLASFLAYLAGQGNVQPCYIATDSMPVMQDEVLASLAAHLQLPMVQQKWGEISGKRLSNQLLLDSGYQLRYPNWQSGYHSIKI